MFLLRAQVSIHVVNCGGHYLELDFIQLFLDMMLSCYVLQIS